MSSNVHWLTAWSQLVAEATFLYVGLILEDNHKNKRELSGLKRDQKYFLKLRKSLPNEFIEAELEWIEIQMHKHQFINYRKLEKRRGGQLRIPIDALELILAAICQSKMDKAIWWEVRWFLNNTSKCQDNNRILHTPLAFLANTSWPKHLKVHFKEIGWNLSTKETTAENGFRSRLKNRIFRLIKTSNLSSVKRIQEYPALTPLQKRLAIACYPLSLKDWEKDRFPSLLIKIKKRQEFLSALVAHPDSKKGGRASPFQLALAKEPLIGGQLFNDLESPKIRLHDSRYIYLNL
jgi:hypothetical protein